ncbi:MAG: OstA-like protein [Flavobacteriaceae bacterium]|nr:OstA-like protein [Flavobacteriaceae bacterium]
MNKLRIFRLAFLLYCCFQSLQAQNTDQKEIHFVGGGNIQIDEKRFPGAQIFQKRLNQVEFEHDGARMFCDWAVLYRKEQRLKAFGNVLFKQGDTVNMRSGFVEYRGSDRIAVAYDTVVLQNNQMTLEVDTLHLDRNKQMAYYDSFGTVKDTANVLTSQQGRYYMEPKKYEFEQEVHIENEQYTMTSSRLDYYTTTKNAYMYGPSTINGKDYRIYCERGFYSTAVEHGYGIKNTRIDYNDRIIYGDSLYFDKKREFASASNNIRVLDTVNNGVVRGHYAEVYKAKDSVFITKRAVAINLVEKDSTYIHGDTLMITGKKDHRILRAFQAARIFKKDMSGKCDSIHFDQQSGLIQLITRQPEMEEKRFAAKNYPILWSGQNQITGENIHLLTDVKGEKLDSLKVFNHAFVIEKDTLAENQYNQVKGQELYGLFEDNKLKVIDIYKNTEVIYYFYDEKNQLVGIDKTVASAMKITLKENQIEDIFFYTNADGTINPEEELPPNARRLSGFVFRGEERLLHQDSIFDADDRNIELVHIRGLEEGYFMDQNEPDKKPMEERSKPRSKAMLNPNDKHKSKQVKKQ